MTTAPTTNQASNETKKPSIFHSDVELKATIFDVNTTENGIFVNLSVPNGKNIDNKQSYLSISARVGNSPHLNHLMAILSNCEFKNGIVCTVKLTNLKAYHSKNADGTLAVDKNGEPYINHSAFLNGIAFN